MCVQEILRFFEKAYLWFGCTQTFDQLLGNNEGHTGAMSSFLGHEGTAIQYISHGLMEMRNFNGDSICEW